MMPENEGKTYRLYAMPVSQESVETAEMHRFSRITPFYLLIYTEEKISECAAEITENEVERLTSADRDWLLGCNIVLLTEDAMRREKEISVTLGEKIERLEKALEAASKEIKDREGHHGRGNKKPDC